MTYLLKRNQPKTIMSYPLRPDSRARSSDVLTLAEFAAEFGGESDRVEFKEGLSQRTISETVVAFSNSEGGVLLIGVTDQGEVKGFDLNGHQEGRIHGFIGQLHNPGRYEIRRVAVEDRPVVLVVVERRVEGFSQMSDGRVLVRRGASNRALVGAGLSDFIASRSLRRFETTSTDSDFDAADRELTEELARLWSWSEETLVERLEEHRFLSRTEHGDRLTVAGALFLLREPHSALGKTFIEIFSYRGEGSDYNLRVEMKGPLPSQIRDTTAYVLSMVGRDLVVIGLRRFDLPRLPEIVLREAIANALAHRSYEFKGTPVRIEIRPDRVVVTSPGGLPEPVTIENIREQQAARNPEIIRTLRRCGLAEDAGRGIGVMQDEMAYNLLEPPEISEDGSSVSVALPLSSTVSLEERVWVADLQRRGSLEPRDSLLLVFAARGEVLTNSEARRILGADRDEARLALHRLRDEGLLVQQGERGGAEYLIHPDHGLAPGLRLLHEEVESLVVDMALEGPVTNERVRERTGLDRAKAGALLARLVSDNRLERRGERRGTHYVLPRGSKPSDR